MGDWEVAQLPRDEDGQLITAVWPGGYPVLYVCDDGGCLCPDCANGKNAAASHVGGDADGWRIDGWFTHYEGPPEQCDHCHAEIESAYGDPDEEEYL
jgi:hypothetical protein